jgi:hypothetical protein
MKNSEKREKMGNNARKLAVYSTQESGPGGPPSVAWLMARLKGQGLLSLPFRF